MRAVQPEGQRGSLKWIQRAIAEGWGGLTDPLLSNLPRATRIGWLSPLAKDEYAEYRDAAFLRLLGLGHLVDRLADFWPKCGPQWDALATTDADHVILVEAKAHIGEFCSPPSKASPKSLALIDASLRATAIAIGVKEASLDCWGRHFYQYANRLAHLNWLRSHDVDAKLALVNFTHDADMPGDTTREAWEAAYLVADHVLGIPARHSLARHVIHIYPAVGEANQGSE